MPRHGFVYVDTGQPVREYGQSYLRASRGDGAPAEPLFVNAANVTGYTPEEGVAGTSLLVVGPDGGRMIVTRTATTPTGVPATPEMVTYLTQVGGNLKTAGDKVPGATINATGPLLERIGTAAAKPLTDEDATPWAHVPRNLEEMTRRVTADRGDLEARGLIAPGDRLSGVDFTGADFHRGGQQVLFLTFTNPERPENRTRIVYKPSSLDVDAALFDQGSGTSVAEALDPSGTLIGRYHIVAKTGHGGHGYGYQEFVRTGPGAHPTTKDDLLGVYRSIGASMAMSYLVGLDDVHQENVLLLKDRIQVIDMEATTGVFKTDDDKGFNSQLWGKALMRIREDLGKLGMQNRLAEVPSTPEAVTAAETGFKQVLANRRAPDPTALAGSRSRFVPLATMAFGAAIATIAKENMDYAAWAARLDTDAPAADPNSPEKDANVVQSMIGHSGVTPADAVTILKRQAVFDALRRGDIPLFTRDLGSSQIYDEAGTAFTLTAHPKVGAGIATEMRGRAEGATDEPLRHFEIFVSKQIEIMNAHVRQFARADR